MARIRTIKPEFWSDEKLSHLSSVDRLTFLGLISMADDYGRLHDNVKIIDAFVFPNTDDTVRESLANLSRMNRIRRGKASSGMPVIEIVNWERHQKVDKPQPKLALPKIEKITRENAGSESFENHSRTVRELVAPHTTDLRPTITDQRPTSGRPVRECPPTVDEISHYLFSIGKEPSESQKIFDFYSANGWVQGNNDKPIVDWHAACRAWFNSDVAKRQSQKRPQCSQVDIPAESMFAQ